MANEYLQEILDSLEEADEAERVVLMNEEDWNSEDGIPEEEEQLDASEGQRVKYRVVGYNQELITPLGCYDDLSEAIAQFDELLETIDDSQLYELVELERVVLSLTGEVMQLRIEFRATSEKFMAEEAEVEEVVC